MRRMRVHGLVQLLTLALSSTAWSAQVSPSKDGIHVKKPKEDCPCPPTHVPNCPSDGLWCPPWWPCTFETGPVEPSSPVPLPISVTGYWMLPHSKISNLTLVPLTGSGGSGSRTLPFRLLGGLGASGGGESVSGSSSSPLFGPEIDYPLPSEATSWLPFDAVVQIYARVLVGDMEIDGENTDVQEYSGGVRLAVPLWKPSEFMLSPYVSVGPSYLNTEFGHVTGMEAALGLRMDYGLSRSLSLVLQLEIDTFWASDFFSWGPAGTAGLTIGF